jgi:hypothetical protein
LPSLALVKEFYLQWKPSSGYFNTWGSLGKLIVPLKKKIAAWVLEEAGKNGREHCASSARSHEPLSDCA